ELFITASEKIPDIEQLVYIFHYHPQSFARHENAALMVASHFLSEKDTANYETLRSLFKNKEETAEWFILNADYLTLQGKNEEAVQLLKSRYFEGSKDTPRLVRLALFHINEHPKVAWEYLD